MGEVGPLWDGNEVWLVVGGGVLFAAFPLVYASLFSGFYAAMMIILLSFRVFISTNRSGQFQRWQGGWLLGVYLVYVFLQYALNMGSAH